jgi:Fe-S cluster assembly protein SufD
MQVPENTQLKYSWAVRELTEREIIIELAAHAQLELELDLTNYPSNLELTFKFNLTGSGASIKLISRAILRKQQEIKITTEQNHLAPDTTSDLLLKTVCFDQAKWSYNGKIFVSPAGHRTVASQVNHNLLVTSTVPALGNLRSFNEVGQAISIPALEVLTNDVKCTHGSAVGQVDRDSLYYLMARGLTADQAETVLLESFLG